MLHFEVTNLLMNSCPEVGLAQFFVFMNAKKLHNARVILWLSRGHKDIYRHPEDELEDRVSIATETKVIKVSLELDDFI